MGKYNIRVVHGVKEKKRLGNNFCYNKYLNSFFIYITFKHLGYINRILFFYFYISKLKIKNEKFDSNIFL